MEQSKRISFRQKNATVCPVCSNEFFKEDMLSGRGRLIAGTLTDELRRNYEDNKKFGKVYPLAYPVSVCPKCLYSSYQKDFASLEQNEIDALRRATAARHATISKVFGSLNFEMDRNLQLGAASYMLAVDCYNLRGKQSAPTFKRAVSSIRAAWLFKDLAILHPEKPYKKIMFFFYKKAFVYYMKVLDYIQSGEEPSEAAGNMGPDTDRNWGYEGILYVSSVLTVKIGSKEKDLDRRIENYNNSKKYLSRLFGMGKSSKSRPGELLDKTKDLYEKMNETLDKWNKEKDTESH